MQYSVCSLAVLSAAFLVHSSSAQTPLYVEAYSVTNRFIELKDFNNAGDLLVGVDATASGQTTPALLRSGTVIPLHPTGTPNISSIMVSAISEVRDDGGLFVAGTAIMNDGFWRAALWNVTGDGSFTFRTMPNIILPEDSSAPGEQHKSYGYAVNKAGVLAGAGDSYLASLATVWTPPYANAVRYLLSTGSAFTDINEAGLLVANGVEFDHGNENNRYAAAVTFAGGVPNEIPLLELPPATLWPNEARSMSGEWVAGDARLRSGTRGFAWKINSPAVINLPNPSNVPFEQDSFMQASSINSSGHAVGFFNGGSHSTRPILWHYDSQRHNAHFLSTLIVGTPYPDYRAEYDVKINDQHQIAFTTRELNQMILRVFKPLTNGLVELAQESVWANEESGQAEFRVRLHRPLGNKSSATLNFDLIAGSARAGVDYIANRASVTWEPSESGEKIISIPLINDTVMRPERSFSLRLTGGSNVDLASIRENVCTISEDYQYFSPRNQHTVGWNYGCAVLHGKSEVILKIARTGGSDGAIVFTNFRSFGFNTEAGVDYRLPENLSLSWAAGETNVKTLIIPLLGTPKPTETKTFSISADATFTGTDQTASLIANVLIVLTLADAPPVVDTSSVQRLLDNLSLTISTVQGSILELEKSLDGLSAWSTAAEANSEDGEVQFNAPVDLSKKSGFFRIRVKE